MNLKDLHPAFFAAAHAAEPVYSPVLDEFCIKTGLKHQYSFLLMAVPTFEPKPVSAQLLSIRSPYTSPAYFNASLQKLAQQGLLVLVTADAYRLTSTGQHTLKTLLDQIHTALGSVQPLTVTKMMDLASRLNELADACLQAPDPPGTWSIQHSRRLDPGRKAPMVARIDQFLSELLAFRDDAHLAAWHAYESNGHAWDILTYLSLNQGGSASSINLALSRRGNSMAQTLDAVDHLVRKGWVTNTNGALHVTPFGIEVHQTAEETTDRYYLIPFRFFNDEFLSKTVDLVNEYRRGLSV